MGHRAGGQTVREIVEMARDVGLGQLTLYSFSTENWKRPLEEVSAIMKLFGEYLLKGFNYKDRNIRIKFLGDRAALDARVFPDSAAEAPVMAGLA